MEANVNISSKSPRLLCRYNNAVDCVCPPPTGCECCGWNPKVTERRKVEINERMLHKDEEAKHAVNVRIRSVLESFSKYKDNDDARIKAMNVSTSEYLVPIWKLLLPLSSETILNITELTKTGVSEVFTGDVNHALEFFSEHLESCERSIALMSIEEVSGSLNIVLREVASEAEEEIN